MLASLVMQSNQNHPVSVGPDVFTCGRRFLQVVHDQLRSSDVDQDSYELILSETFGDDDLPLELRRRPDAVWVDQLSTYPVGLGIGRRVLAVLLEAADEEGVALALVPTPFLVGGGLEYGPLVEWYERHGFVQGFDDSVWLREPVR